MLLGHVDFHEMKTGLERLEIEPAILFTYEDYEEFKRGLIYVDEKGSISDPPYTPCKSLG